MTSTALNLNATDLAEYQRGVHRAKQVRHECFDCLESSGGICPRHRGQCIGCSSDAVVEKDAHEYADKVPGWFCAECGGVPPTERMTGDPMVPKIMDR